MQFEGRFLQSFIELWTTNSKCLKYNSKQVFKQGKDMENH